MPKGKLNRITLRYEDTEQFPFGEILWAREVDFDLYKLDDIPFFSEDYGLGDFVVTDDNLTILECRERCSRTRHVRYREESGLKESGDQQRRIRDFLKRTGIESDPNVGGYLSLAVPLDVDDDKLSLVLRSCDDALELVNVAHMLSLLGNQVYKGHRP